MTNWKAVDAIAKATEGKTIERMEICSGRVEIDFTDGSSVEIEFDHDEAYGFSVTAEVK